MTDGLHLKNTFKRNDVIGIRLSSGEEILARYESEDSENYYVMKPHLVILQPNPQNPNQVSPALMPYFLCADHTKQINLRKNQVLTVTQPHPDAAKMYMGSTSPIQQASSLSGLEGLGNLKSGS